MIRDFAKRVYAIFDPLYLDEYRQQRYVFTRIQEKGLLSAFRGKRILEIGPKHGRDSRLLAALEPEELVMIDLPEKKAMVNTWLAELPHPERCRLILNNLQYMSREELAALGRFDLVWCTGVIYHVVEQIRFLRRLFHLCKNGGLAVIETEIAHGSFLQRRNVVELIWPGPFHGDSSVTHLPSPKAMMTWMQMVGFQEIGQQPILSRHTRRTRAVFTGRRTESSTPYDIYGGQSAGNDAYFAGDAT
ncbi:MAG: class I SAM-dependent methyltransferase [Verrucomicrobia bacterium]|nr:class I SAM-dependent methyltransferase [Verrucomicrobiota bacterium]